MLGDKYAATVKEATYASTDASIDRQIVELTATGCNALIAATIPPLAVQTIRKVPDLGWTPMFFMNNVSASVPVILEPARPASWHESTGDLLAGVEVTDETDSMPGELFDELFNQRSERPPANAEGGTKAG